MEHYVWLQYAHIIAFVYWLGGDFGTYVASRHVIRKDIGVEARRIALKIMLVCDQGPRLAMPTSFVLGFQMALSLGLMTVPTWVAVVVWAVCLAWLANVLLLHFQEGKPFSARLAAIDFRFRFVVIALLIATAGYGLVGAAYLADDRIAWKMLVFAGLVASGIMIRRHLRPFMPAFASLVANGPSPTVNETLEQSLKNCRPYVAAIWLGLFLNAAIGVRLL